MTNAHLHFSRFVASARMTNHRLQPSVFVAPWQARGVNTRLATVSPGGAFSTPAPF
jgi:hypothetical protein